MSMLVGMRLLCFMYLLVCWGVCKFVSWAGLLLGPPLL